VPRHFLLVDQAYADPSADPHPVRTATLPAGIDGTKPKPGDAMDRNPCDLPPEDIEELPTVAFSLRAALDARDADQDFLLRGEVMSDDLLRAYIQLKRAEVDQVEATPHPAELLLYYGL
jgi:glutamine synthetase